MPNPALKPTGALMTSSCGTWGILAVYRVTNEGQLKRLKRWPIQIVCEMFGLETPPALLLRSSIESTIGKHLDANAGSTN